MPSRVSIAPFSRRATAATRLSRARPRPFGAVFVAAVPGSSTIVRMDGRLAEGRQIGRQWWRWRRRAGRRRRFGVRRQQIVAIRAAASSASSSSVRPVARTGVDGDRIAGIDEVNRGRERLLRQGRQRGVSASASGPGNRRGPST
jgi:hypothetical protein